MIRKVGAALLMIMSAIGTILCIAIIIGAWVANNPATIAVTGSLDTVDGYLDLAEQTTEQTETQLETVQSLVDRVVAVSPDQLAAVRDELEQRVVPVVTQLQRTMTALHNTLVALDRSLDQLNALPGISTPTMGEDLERIDQRLVEVNHGLNDLATELAAAEMDGERVANVAGRVSAELAAARGAINGWTGNIEAMRAATASAMQATPALFDLTSTAVSLLFLLLGAGQVALFIVGLRLFRNESL